MKNLIIIVISFIVIFGIGFFLDSNSLPTKIESNTVLESNIEMKLDNFKFSDIKSNEFEIKDFNGKIVILNFWASWCAPCIEEFPEILNVVKKYKKDIVLIAISNDNRKKDILKFMRKFKEKFNLNEKNIVIGFDPNRHISSGLFNVLKLPETFILNRSGNIIKKVVGAQMWKNGEALKFISEQI